MTAFLDHLVIAAPDLLQGQAWLEGRLGVPLQAGGKHEPFGTHNALLSLGPRSYLEVIAVNPAVPVPPRPRWFALDTPDMQARLAGGPALIHWVAAVGHLLSGPEALELARGDYRWTLTVPPDGSMPLGGTAPSLIVWQTPSPAHHLPDRGVRLAHLYLGTPQPDRLRERLKQLAFSGEVEVYEAPQPELKATLHTPEGLVEL